MLWGIHCQRRHVRGSARARTHLVVFSNLKSREVTARAFGGGHVLGVGVYLGVHSRQFNVWFVVLCVVLDVRIIGVLEFLEIVFICNF